MKNHRTPATLRRLAAKLDRQAREWETQIPTLPHKVRRTVVHQDRETTQADARRMVSEARAMAEEMRQQADGLEEPLSGPL